MVGWVGDGEGMGMGDGDGWVGGWVGGHWTLLDNNVPNALPGPLVYMDTILFCKIWVTGFCSICHFSVPKIFKQTVG